MDSTELIHRIYEYVEEGRVDNAVAACLRLARATNDVLNAVIFIRELYPDPDQLRRAIFDEVEGLKDEAQRYVWETAQERWLKERELDYSLDDDDDERRILAMGVGELLREVELMEQSVEDLRLPPRMGEYDTAAFTDRDRYPKTRARLKIRACNTVLERIRTRCLVYATRVEKQLNAAASSSDFMASVQTTVHNYYAERDDTVYRRLRTADRLVESSDPEDHALLLTSIRRAVRAAADYHYPAKSEPVQCSDGVTRTLGREQYLNRLEEFCRSDLSSDSSARLLQAELGFLASFVRRLHDIASKGVHSEVTVTEARQGVLGVYLFLSNLIAKLERDVPDVATEGSS